MIESQWTAVVFRTVCRLLEDIAPHARFASCSSICVFVLSVCMDTCLTLFGLILLQVCFSERVCVWVVTSTVNTGTRLCFMVCVCYSDKSMFMNEGMMHVYSDLLSIVVHPKHFTIMWGGLSSLFICMLL